MGQSKGNTNSRTVGRTGGVSAPSPWREAGWIFKDGTIIAIERRGVLTRERREHALEGDGRD
jgi:hypothetical protein